MGGSVEDEDENEVWERGVGEHPGDTTFICDTIKGDEDVPPQKRQGN